MKIEFIALRGFRCFDEAGETINLDNLTCFLGPNASGKTAAMIALARVFGESNSQRQIVPADFYLTAGEELRAKSPRTLSIECRLVFPELEDEDAAKSAAIPETFNQMIVDRPGGTPYCRIRLDATWTNDGTPSGEVEQAISWILTDSDDPDVIEDGNRRRVQAGDRGRIRVVYVPAARDPDHQIRTATTSSFGRLLNALAWNGVEESLKEKLTSLQDLLAGLPGVQTMNTKVKDVWRGLYDGRVANEVAFQALEEDPAALVRLLVPAFSPGEDGRTMTASDLSDGLRSLFSLALSLGLFHVEEQLRERAADSGFKVDVTENLPVLTVFAVEEPENHLSPHYLGRVVQMLSRIAVDEHAQVLISSHSPSIAGRVKPDNVRYFLGHERTPSTHVKPIPLPSDNSDEAFKYVREAVRGFPELYFARLVVLGEGASEQIVLRRLFEASGTPLDTHFISVVPLGGRHVNHFWRLLHGLGIPYLTLLDLDREKEGAGWGRIQYVRDQLLKLHGKGSDALKFRDHGNSIRSLDEEAYENLRQYRDKDIEPLDAALEVFQESFNVFFSSPLDLDFSMLEAFPETFKGLAPHPKGPRLPDEVTPDFQIAVDQRMKQVLAADASKAPAELGSTYTQSQRALFAWYKYLFVDGSKPVAHWRALSALDDEVLLEGVPCTLKRLVQRARQLLGPVVSVL